MLAAHLSINRNTVARAYAELRDQGFVVARRRSGVIVAGASEARDKARTVTRPARSSGAIARCLELGLSPGEISSLAYHHSLQVERLDVKISFVECNAERAELCPRAVRTARHPGDPTGAFRVRPRGPERRRPRPRPSTTSARCESARQTAGARAPTGGGGDRDAPHLTTLVKLAQRRSRARRHPVRDPRPGRVDPAVVRTGEPQAST